MDLPENYAYYNVSDKVIRTKFHSREEVDEWVKDLQKCTKMTWSITRTIITPVHTSKKQVFKRIYHCQFNTKLKQPHLPRKRAHSSKNLSCPSELIISIKRQMKQKSRARVIDNLLPDWPCVIIFKNEHNHSLHSVDALMKRPIGEETKQEILNLFEKGHSVVSAYRTYCFWKMDKLGDEYEKYIADRYYFPTKSDFSNLWKVNFKDHCNDWSSEEIFARLERNLSNIEDVSYKISCVGENYSVSLCTPIMKHAADELQQLSLLFFTRNSVKNHNLYFLATHSPAGRIPLGCIITTSQNIEVFDSAMRNLLEILPKKIKPLVILTDDMAENNMLKKYWPNSEIFVCTFHLLKSVWSWLCSAKNKIFKEDRQALYLLFRKILSSKSRTDVELSVQQFKNSELCVTYPQYATFVNNMMTNIKSWCLYYRQHLMTECSETNNYMEFMLRLFKENLFKKTRACNLVVLVDFVVTSFENFYKQRLLDLIMNKITKFTINYFHLKDCDVPPEQIKDIGDMQYEIGEPENAYLPWYVDMRGNVCTCDQGLTGTICKHQSAILMNCQLNEAYNFLTPKSKLVIHTIATGVGANKNVSPPVKLEVYEETALKTENACNNQQDDENDSMLATFEDVKHEIPVFQSIENKWSNFINQLDSDVRNNLKSDSGDFSAAVECFINNYNRNIINASTLLNGLKTSFQNHINEEE